ncbi:hypothetical protein Mycch_5361 (plasmid) [Mycolicibacterium chubuense NBB4]|uniref:50S ribosomal protein L7ae n=1 Tax=Mycolicibacterium chubuense (strain NBB4) TaxID=710421 RepID=I4BRY1_MYCCN|nr:hypothetical protein [Mycolicibacterium chubuense]AFM20038.1 hypothetical protein Mycch_5361 [Mycolicibacterium chubuense NBB4]
MSRSAHADATGGDDPSTGAARSTVNVSGDLLAVSRAAVRLVRARTGRAYSLRQFTEEALMAQIQTIAETYNDGHVIRPDDTPLEKGRVWG